MRAFVFAMAAHVYSLITDEAKRHGHMNSQLEKKAMSENKEILFNGDMMIT